MHVRILYAKVFLQTNCQIKCNTYGKKPKVLLQVFYILYIFQVYYSLNLSYNLIHQYLLLINPSPQDKTPLKVHYYFHLCLFAMHRMDHKNKFYILILFLFSQILKILYLYQKLLFLLILLENLLMHLLLLVLHFPTFYFQLVLLYNIQIFFLLKLRNNIYFSFYDLICLILLYLLPNDLSIAFCIFLQVFS